MDTSPARDNNEPEFPCFLCGVCCSRYQVRITLGEARRISEKLGIGWDEFLEGYTDSRWPGETSLLLIHKNKRCVFLKKSAGEPVHTCSIHPFKPSSCIQWTPGPFRRECQEGLRTYWRLDVDEQGRLTGKPEELERFCGFLSSFSLDPAEPEE